MKSPPTQAEFVIVRDFVITETVIANASRAGAIAIMTAEEFLQYRRVGDQMIISVHEHKTAHCHGPAKIIVGVALHEWLQAR